MTTSPTVPADASRQSRVGRMRPRWIVAGSLLAVVVLLVVFWDWNWFRPFVEARASAALGRPVSIHHFDLQPGRSSVLIADNVEIANPSGFVADAPFATIQRLTVTVDVTAYLKGRQIVVPSVVVDHPIIDARRDSSGAPNWIFPALSSQPGAPPADVPQVGDLEINDGHAHLLDPALKADVTMDIATASELVKGERGIQVSAKGTYAGQPVTGRAVGGALLSLRDSTQPYPVNLEIVNGPTRISLVGIVRDPLSFGGADLKLKLTGTDMALLYPITGIPLPKTPSYEVIGNLDYSARQILFRNVSGRVGSSDIGGNLTVDPHANPAVLTADLASRRVDLADLGGFIGSEPGRMSTPNQTPQQKQDLARAEASPKLLPTKRIDIPLLKTMDVHLKYRGDQIIGRGVPFDRINTVLDIESGRIRLSPLALGVGRGQIEGTIDLTPLSDKQYRLHSNIGVQQIDLSRLLAATGVTNGSGTVGGRAVIDSTGDSVSTFAGNGNGSVQLVMSGGGDLSALLVALSGLQFGNAVLSALGIPSRDQIECFVGDWALQQGQLSTRTVILDTSHNIVSGSGSVNLRNETIDYELKTKSKHFSIGSLPAPIAISGPFKSPSIRPEALPLAARGAAAVGLAFLFPPAALLPTIQFGVGDDSHCGPLTRGRK